MTKIFSFFLFFSLLQQNAFAQQPTPAEMQKRIDAALKDPKIKAMIEQAQKTKGVTGNIMNADSLRKLTRTKMQQGGGKIKNNDSTVFSLASGNEKYLNALPIRTFTKAELVSYLHNLNIKLTELLRSDYGTDIKNIPIGSAIEGSETSIALWLNNQQSASALLILKAAEIDVDNSTALNNAGGILTNAGLGVNAIPILQYILVKDPGNNTILNNIGQAYLSLGDGKTAENYLLQCVKDSKYHPDANLALAYINYGRGNKAGSLKYAENSLRGAFTVPAYNLVDKLKPDAKLMDYIKHRYKQPEYFNFDKYPLLPQCRDTKKTPILKPQYAAYKEMLAGVKKKYTQLIKDEEAISEKEVTDKMMAANKMNKNPYRPFGLFANIVVADLAANEYNDRFLKFAEYKKNYQGKKAKLIADCLAEQKAITAKNKSQKDDVAERDGEGNGGSEYDDLTAAICAEKETVRNRYLNLIADANEAYQQKAMILYKQYFNDMGFWYYVASVSDHQYKAEFYALVLQFLDVLTEINTAYFYTPCQPVDAAGGNAKTIQIDDPDCYLPEPLKIPMGIATVDISCNEYKIEGGEGFIFNVHHNRLSGQTTLAFGPGAKVPDMPKFSDMGVSVETGAKLSGQVFLQIDNDGSVLDGGFIFTGKIDVKAKAFGVGKTISDNETVTIGINSGVQMKEGGALKNLIDKTWYVQPDAKQTNKNVPLYKK